MIEYTQQYIRPLLDRYMEGTSTLQEEDILCRYFTQGHVPAEWEPYRLLFAEIEAMKPAYTETEAMYTASKSKRRWLRWSVAAAIAGIGWLALWTSSHHPSEQPLMAEKQTEQRDSVGQEIPDKKQQPEKTPVKKQDDVKQQSDTPSVKTRDDDVTVPKKRRSLRKPQPTMTDYDKAYTLMAEAEQERRNIEKEMEQCQQQLIEAQLAAYGYIPVMQEDGSILYINEQTEYIAYEE
jgi:Rieske Fe-S protein